MTLTLVAAQAMPLLRCLLWGLCLLHWVVASPLSLLAPHALPGDDPSKAVFVFSAMEDARTDIRSGFYRARGRHVVVSADGTETSSPIKVTCVFDYEKGYFRFDREQLRRSRLAPDSQGDTDSALASANSTNAATPAHKQVEARYVRTPKKSIHWSSTDATCVHVYDPERHPNGYVKPYDIRAFGLGMLPEFRSGQTPSEAISALRLATVKSATISGATKVAHLALALPNPAGTICELWLRSDQGFTPFHMEATLPKEFKTADPTRPASQADITWEERGGTWVPKSLVLESCLTKRQWYELTLDWESVNEPLPETLFGVSDLRLSPGSAIIDHRTPQPVVVGYFGSTNLNVPDEPTAPSNSLLRFLPIAATTIIACSLLGAYALKMRRHRRSPS